MPNKKHLLTLSIACLALLCLAGCSSRALPKSKVSIAGEEKFSNQSQYERSYDIPAELACETSNRVLLSQGYLISQATGKAVIGNKSFQPDHGNHIKLDIVVTCLNSKAGATLYVAAKQTFFELKASSNAADLSLAGMGSISVPIGSSSDSLVKVGEETISESRFYDRYFELFESKLKSN